MLRLIKPMLPTFIVFFVTWLPTEARIQRVPKKFTIVEFYGGYSHPIGNYHIIGNENFESGGRIIDLEASKVYDPTFHFGLSYGQLVRGHFLYGIGFMYTKIHTEDTFFVSSGEFYVFTPVKPAFNQYDIFLNLNFTPTDISSSPLSPYAGIGLCAGLTSQTAPGYASENWLTGAVGLNFGADFKIWGPPKSRSLVTLSSVNSLQVLASDKRPKYVNIGFGIKYYFRP
jgi:hypothetical protein